MKFYFLLEFFYLSMNQEPPRLQLTGVLDVLGPSFNGNLLVRRVLLGHTSETFQADETVVSSQSGSCSKQGSCGKREAQQAEISV